MSESENKKHQSVNEVKLDTLVMPAVKEYQCPGCVGSGENCFSKSSDLSCDAHVVGTLGSHIGKFILGLPKGFNRLGACENTKINIFENFEDGWGYDLFNVPVWKHKNKLGHTIVRGFCPRVNYPFIHIFLEDCIEKIDCKEITAKDISEMD